jgi:HEAT repeat protein
MSESVEKAIALLQDRKTEPAERVRAAERLAAVDDDRARLALIAALEGSGDDLRDSAVEALKHRHHIDRLVKWLASPDEETRERAASVFKYLWDERARESLHALLRGGKSNELRLAAVWSLALHPDERSRTALKGALKDPDMLVRVWASRGLEKIARPEDESVLVRSLDDENEDVRISIARALSRIGTESSRAAIRKRIERESSYRVQQAMKSLLN